MSNPNYKRGSKGSLGPQGAESELEAEDPEPASGGGPDGSTDKSDRESDPDVGKPEDDIRIHYKETQQDVRGQLVTITPLDCQFKAYATAPTRGKKDEEPKIELFAIEAWFEQAKIFDAIGGKLSPHDVGVVFNRQ
jgi:hypothetical protein